MASVSEPLASARNACRQELSPTGRAVENDCIPAGNTEFLGFLLGAPVQATLAAASDQSDYMFAARQPAEPDRSARPAGSAAAVRDSDDSSASADSTRPPSPLEQVAADLQNNVFPISTSVVAGDDLMSLVAGRRSALLPPSPTAYSSSSSLSSSPGTVTGGLRRRHAASARETDNHNASHKWDGDDIIDGSGSNSTSDSSPGPAAVSDSNSQSSPALSSSSAASSSRDQHPLANARRGGPVHHRSKYKGELRRESFGNWLAHLAFFVLFLPLCIIYCWHSYIHWWVGRVNDRLQQQQLLHLQAQPGAAPINQVFQLHHQSRAALQAGQAYALTPSDQLPSQHPAAPAASPADDADGAGVEDGAHGGASSGHTHEAHDQHHGMHERPRKQKKDRRKPAGDTSGEGSGGSEPRRVSNSVPPVTATPVPLAAPQLRQVMQHQQKCIPYLTRIDASASSADIRYWCPSSDSPHAMSSIPLHISPTSIDLKAGSSKVQAHLAVNTPNLPRWSLSRPGWGAAHVPLPPSWALVQAPSSLIHNHRPVDMAMCSDGSGNCWGLWELSAIEAELISNEVDREPDIQHCTAKQRLLHRSGALSHPHMRCRMAAARASSPPLRAADGAPIASPTSSASTMTADTYRQFAVVAAMRHAWGAYRQHAWGFDSLKPTSRLGDNPFGGMCVTLVDSLDTLLLMGYGGLDGSGGGQAGLNQQREWMMRQFNESLDKMETCLILRDQEDVNLFEITIRVIGGLLSAYELHRHLNNIADERLLRKAVHVADALSFAFESPTGIPYGTLGLKSKRKYNPAWVAGSTIAEVATLTLEWEHLSHVTGNPKYALLVRRALAHMLVYEIPTDSLWPTFIHPDTGDWTSTSVTLGARGDSTYEYLLKAYLIAGGGGASGDGDGQEGEAAGSASAAATTGDDADNGHLLVGNAALLEPSSRQPLTTASYAPPRASAAGAVWRSAAGAPLDAFDEGRRDGFAGEWSLDVSGSDVNEATVVGGALPESLSASSLASGSLYHMAVAEYERAARAMAGRGRDGSSGGGAGSQAAVDVVHPDPTGYLSPWSSPITVASETSWFTNLYGAYLRSVAGMEHQLIREGGGAVSTAGTGAGAGTGAVGRDPAVSDVDAATNTGYTYIIERGGAAVVREKQPPQQPQDNQPGALDHVAATIASPPSIGQRQVDIDADARVAALDFAAINAAVDGLNRGDANHQDGVASPAASASSPASASPPDSAPVPPAGVDLPAFSIDHKMDHLACFVPGMLALSSTIAPTQGLRSKHVSLAKRLMRTCMRMYTVNPTGLAAEISRFDPNQHGDQGGPRPDHNSKHSLLRPETTESLFILYRVTGDALYRDWGWRIFSALENHARLRPDQGAGYSSVRDVTAGHGVSHCDGMDSFFLAETLKYLYLLFSDASFLPLDQWVFNTEAHPLPVWRRP